MWQSSFDAGQSLSDLWREAQAQNQHDYLAGAGRDNFLRVEVMHHRFANRNEATSCFKIRLF
ncbi:hypothetical protein BVH03_22100 [Pseudomonas sp. PA15(2017)]|nr:hypothetical protein BVH03_22100 [Pseudomonas sp. PA15(2017)]